MTGTIFFPKDIIFSEQQKEYILESLPLTSQIEGHTISIPFNDNGTLVSLHFQKKELIGTRETAWELTHINHKSK